jgi:sensor histidine kinase YesM
MSFSILVILPILASTLFSNKITGDIILEKINNANIDSLNRTSQRINKLLDDITFTLLNMARNAELNNILKSDRAMVRKGSYQSANKAEIIRKHNEMNFIFDNAPLTMIMYGSYITVLTDSGADYGNWEEFYKYSSVLKENKWYPELMNSYSANVLWIGINRSFTRSPNKNSYILEAAIPIKEVEEGRPSTFDNIGVIHIAVSESIIYDLMKSDNSDSMIFMVDNQGSIISSKNKADMKTTFTRYVNELKLDQQDEGWYIDRDNNGESTVVSYSTVSKTGWKVVSITPQAKMLAPLFNVRNILVVTNLIFILLFILVSLLISNSISKPIIKLNQQIRKVENGNLDERVKVIYNDEIGNLSRNFNNMLDDVSKLLKLTKVQEKLKREAEFEALQAQINPHFLFNTLSSIRWAAAAGGNTKAEEMVLALSNLLKMSINRGPELILLEEEIEILRHYVNLVQMKQGFSFDLCFQIPEELLKTRIPRLLLQPIVENSIIHGFGDRKDDGKIIITARAKDSLLKIEIADNGKGIEQQRMDDILSGRTRQEDKSKYFGSIGIRNVNERIKLNYGEEYGISMRNQNEGGTIVTLTLPYHGEESGRAEITAS